MIAKAEYRKQIRATLAAMSPLEIASRSAEICAHVVEHPFWMVSSRVALFAALPREVDLAALWPARGEREFFFPRIVEWRLEFCAVAHAGELELGPFGLLQPALQAAAVELETLDLILLPGLAFSRDGARLGRGGGYYDRTLTPALPAARLAVCFACQLADSLPTEAHDHRVDAVVTELGPA